MARPVKKIEVVAIPPSPPSQVSALPMIGFLRIKQIVGDPKANPPILGIIPISSPSWYNGIKSGRFPKGIKLGPNSVAWRVEDIRALVEKLAAG